jgi:Ser-tRNA(Ala) deacylase AlaX
MTEELFSGDSYMREFEARVVKLDGREVILDRLLSWWRRTARG